MDAIFGELFDFDDDGETDSLELGIDFAAFDYLINNVDPDKLEEMETDEIRALLIETGFNMEDD